MFIYFLKSECIKMKDNMSERTLEYWGWLQENLFAQSCCGLTFRLLWESHTLLPYAKVPNLLVFYWKFKDKGSMTLRYYQFNVILMSLMKKKMMMIMMTATTICATQRTVAGNLFDMMEPGLNITGTRVAELMTTSNIQCSIKYIKVFFQCGDFTCSPSHFKDSWRIFLLGPLFHKC